MNKINVDLWQFKIPSESSSPTEFIHDAIIGYIENQLLRPGDRLPAYRTVAELNGLHRTTMNRIYQRLESKYWLETRVGVGTYVSSNFPGQEMIYPASRVVKKLSPHLLNKKSFKEKKPPNADFLSSGCDMPSKHYFPYQDYNALMKNLVITHQGYNQMQMITAMDNGEFKDAVSHYLNKNRDFMINNDCMEILFGRRESLEVVFRILTLPGDLVLNTSPLDDTLWHVLRNRGLVDHSISMRDPDFMNKLKSFLKQTPIKALYIRPQCSYPEGFALTQEECMELVKLAREYGFYIIEEDDEHELWHHQKIAFKSLIKQDHQGCVIYCGALSLLSTYMQTNRIIVAAEEFITLIKAETVKQSPLRDLLAEKAITILLNNNKIIDAVKKMQREKIQHSFEAWFHLENTVGKIARVYTPSSGLAIWLSFPNDGSLLRILDIFKKQNYRLPFHPDSPEPDGGVCYIRFCFGVWSVEEIQAYANLLLDQLHPGFIPD